MSKPDVLFALPLTRTEVEAFIAQHHKHHLPPIGWVFQVALARAHKVVGGATVGRLVARLLARLLDTGVAAEVTRCCVIEGSAERYAASRRYGACWRIAREMGYQPLITYILPLP